MIAACSVLSLLCQFGDDGRRADLLLDAQPHAVLRRTAPSGESRGVRAPDLGGAEVAAASGVALAVQAQGGLAVPGGGRSFAAEGDRVDVGPDARLAFSSSESFTLALSLRTDSEEFCTPLMCRQGGSVNYSFVMGRVPGTISFELWSWSGEKAVASTRVTDGQWHDVVGAYDAQEKRALLWVDGRLEAVQDIGMDFAPPDAPLLRLGNNIGAHQPFRGELRDCSVRSGVPPGTGEAVAQWEALQVFATGEVDGMLESWLLRQRRPRVPRAGSDADWQRRAAQIAARVQDSLGLWPPPYAATGFGRNASVVPPNDPRWDSAIAPATDFSTFEPTLPRELKRGGRVTRDGASLTRIAWQAFEGYQASGWLYLPEPNPALTSEEGSTARKIPAVLCPHGHWGDGARNAVVQARCWTLACAGYAVLAVDSVHHLDDPIGLTPLSMMIWHDLRGLEVLRSLPFVDADRIGCTGASGGGQQTFYLTALHSGLAAAVPAVMVCYFDEILLSSGVHCYCNFVAGVMAAADEVEMAAAFAPRPQLFLSVTGDWTHAFPRQGFPELRAVYSLFGGAEQVASLQWDHGHDYDREMRNTMYSFFEQHLKGLAQPDPQLEAASDQTLTVSQMRALESQGELKGGLVQDFSCVSREFRQRLAAPKESGPDELRLRIAGRFEFEDQAPRPRLQGREVLAREGGQVQALRVWSEKEVRLPAFLSLPDGAIPPAGFPTVLRVATAGARAQRVAAVESTREFLDAGVAVMDADLRYCGEMDRAHAWREPYGRIFGRGEGVLAAHDLRCFLDVIDELPELDVHRVAVVASGEHAPAGVYAAALDERIGALILPSLGPCYADRARRPAVTGILRIADLDAALALAPARVLVGGVAAGRLNAARGAWSGRQLDVPGASFVSKARGLGEAEVVRAVLSFLGGS